MQNPDQVQLMTEKAEAVSTVVSRISKIAEAFQYAIDLTVEQHGKTLTAVGFETADADVSKAACRTAGLEFLETRLRSRANEIHTSVTPVDWGIAETGTLVLDSTSEDVRLATMLAETHVAVVGSSKIKPDAEALENELRAALGTDAPVYMTFITGASRTADIERVLAIGVHGPGELHILILEEEEI